jgi:hypothetical protein
LKEAGESVRPNRIGLAQAKLVLRNKKSKYLIEIALPCPHPPLPRPLQSQQSGNMNSSFINNRVDDGNNFTLVLGLPRAILNSETTPREATKMFNTINPLQLQAASMLGQSGLGGQLFNGLNSGGGAVAIAGPNGAFASAGGNSIASPGFGGLGGGCGCGGGIPNFGNSFGPGGPGGPGGAYQAGMQAGMKMEKIRRLQKKIARLQAQMGGSPGLAFGGPQSAFSPAGPGGAMAVAGPGGAFASPLGGRLV